MTDKDLNNIIYDILLKDISNSYRFKSLLEFDGYDWESIQDLLTDKLIQKLKELKMLSVEEDTLIDRAYRAIETLESKILQKVPEIIKEMIEDNKNV